jgi:predicted DNA-binding transcriptional regulator AlpA
MNAEMNTERRFLTTEQVRTRYNITNQTIWRWLRDPELDFPRPTMIRRRRFWPEAALDAFDECCRQRRAA